MLVGELYLVAVRLFLGGAGTGGNNEDLDLALQCIVFHENETEFDLQRGGRQLRGLLDAGRQRFSKVEHEVREGNRCYFSSSSSNIVGKSGASVRHLSHAGFCPRHADAGSDGDLSKIGIVMDGSSLPSLSSLVLRWTRSSISIS